MRYNGGRCTLIYMPLNLPRSTILVYSVRPLDSRLSPYHRTFHTTAYPRRSASSHKLLRVSAAIPNHVLLLPSPYPSHRPSCTTAAPPPMSPSPPPLPQTFLYHRRTTKAGPADFNTDAEGLLACLDRRPLPIPLPRKLPPLPRPLPPAPEGPPRGGAKGKLPLVSEKGAAVVLIEVGEGRAQARGDWGASDPRCGRITAIFRPRPVCPGRGRKDKVLSPIIAPPLRRLIHPLLQS